MRTPSLPFVSAVNNVMVSAYCAVWVQVGNIFFFAFEPRCAAIPSVWVLIAGT